MISALLGTDAIVSATISSQGISHPVVLAAQSKQYRLITSAPIVTEVL